MQPIDPVAEVVLGRDHDLRGCRRRRCAEVGDEVGDGHIALVPDGRNNRHGTARNGTRDALLVECPEVFNRAAAAPDDDDVDAGDTPDRPQPRRNIRSGVVSLHAHRANDEMRVRVAAAEHFDDVANGRAVERRHDADLAGERGERPFARLVEQSFALQPLLQLVERELKSAEPLGLHVLANELVLTLRLVDGDAAARDNGQTIGGLEFQIAKRGPEDDGAHLRAGVFQREVQMAGVPDAAVRELALHPHFHELGFEQIADANGELGDREDSGGWSLVVGRGRWSFRSSLVVGHWSLVLSLTEDRRPTTDRSRPTTHRSRPTTHDQRLTTDDQGRRPRLLQTVDRTDPTPSSFSSSSP